MSNAEVALRAAKDLNADSLVPELYRSAVDSFFKAKRDYRLKNFDKARQYALRATRLAEQAEFEAYRMGGATPESESKIVTPEGGTPDPDSAFKESAHQNPPQQSAPPELPPPGASPQKPSAPPPDPEPPAPAEPTPAVPQNSPTSATPPAPGGPTGPSSTSSAATNSKPFSVEFPTGIPNTGSLPQVTPAAGMAGTANGLGSTETAPNKAVDPFYLNQVNKNAKDSGEIPEINAKPLPGLYDNSPNGGEIPSIYGNSEKKDNEGAATSEAASETRNNPRTTE